VINMMVVNNDLPVRNVPELIRYAKQNPGKIAFASDGNGTTAHLGVELFKSMTGTYLLHVPYKAATSAVTDLIGGGVQLMMVQHAGGGPARAGRPRARAGHLVAATLAHLPRRAHRWPTRCPASRWWPGAASSARPTCRATSWRG
jgi:hypothetical protein